MAGHRPSQRCLVFAHLYGAQNRLDLLPQPESKAVTDATTLGGRCMFACTYVRCMRGMSADASDDGRVLSGNQWVSPTDAVEA